MNRGWLPINVRSGMELAISQGITEAGFFECYCPTYRSWEKLPKHLAKSEGRSRRLKELPLLSGYIFANLNFENLHLPALRLKIKGIFGVIKSSAGAMYASNKEIQHLKMLQASGLHDDLKSAKVELVDAVGMRAKIIKGPFEGFCGIVDGQNGKELRVELKNSNNSKFWIDQGLLELTS